MFFRGFFVDIGCINFYYSPTLVYRLGFETPVFPVVNLEYSRVVSVSLKVFHYHICIFCRRSLKCFGVIVCKSGTCDLIRYYAIKLMFSVGFCHCLV